MATIKVCDLCDCRGAETYSFHTGESRFNGVETERLCETRDFCCACLLSILKTVVKQCKLEPMVCTVIKERVNARGHPFKK